MLAQHGRFSEQQVWTYCKLLDDPLGGELDVEAGFAETRLVLARDPYIPYDGEALWAPLSCANVGA